jgi:hypothetical protein
MFHNSLLCVYLFYSVNTHAISATIEAAKKVPSPDTSALIQGRNHLHAISATIEAAKKVTSPITSALIQERNHFHAISATIEAATKETSPDTSALTLAKAIFMRSSAIIIVLPEVEITYTIFLSKNKKHRILNFRRVL